MSKENLPIIIISIVMAVIIAGVVAVFATGIYHTNEAGKSVNGFEGFKIKTEIIQGDDNNSVIMYSILVVPDGFSRTNDLGVRVTEARDAYVNIPPGTMFAKNPNLFLGNNSDLIFTKKGDSLENYLTVPKGMLLDIKYEIWFTENRVWNMDIGINTYRAKRVST